MGRRGRGEVGWLTAVVINLALLAMLDAFLLLSPDYEIDALWRGLQIPVLLAGAGAIWAWYRGNWAAAGVALLVTVSGLWGYFYVGPLVSIVLAGVVFTRRARAA